MQCKSATFKHFCFFSNDHRFVHVPGPALGALHTLLTISIPLCGCCYSCYINEEWYKHTGDSLNGILLTSPHIPT